MKNSLSNWLYRSQIVLKSPKSCGFSKGLLGILSFCFFIVTTETGLAFSEIKPLMTKSVYRLASSDVTNSITSVSQPPTTPTNCQDVTITIMTASDPAAASEHVYIVYTTDEFASSTLVEATFSGTTGTAIIPHQTAASVVKYYAFGSDISSTIGADHIGHTLYSADNGGSNYSYTVSSAFSVTVSSGQGSICEGSTRNVSVSASGGTQPYTFSWSTDYGSIAPTTGNSVVFTPPSTGFITLTAVATDASGCTVSGTSTIAAFPTPSVSISPLSQTICSGTNIAPIIATNNNTNVGSGVINWTQIARTNTTNVTGNFAFATPTSGVGSATIPSNTITNTQSSSQTTTLTIKAATTTSPFCSNQATVTVTVDVKATIITQPSPQTKCEGASATFSATAIASGTLTYEWYKTGNATALQTTSGVASGTANTFTIPSVAAGDAGTYYVVVTGSACPTPVTSSTALLTVNLNPTVNTVVLADICQGSTTVALGGSFGGGATAAVWSDGTAGGSFTNNGGTTPGTTLYTAAANAPTSVTLTLTTSGGSCGTTSANKTLTVNPNPTVNIGSAIAAVCQGGTTAALGGSFGGGATAAVWSDGSAGGSFANNDGSTPNTATYTAAANAPASVTLTLTTSGGSCATISANKSLTVNPTPTAVITSTNTAICIGQTSANITGSVTASGAWTLTLSNAATVTGSGNGTFSINVTPTTTTTYTISSLMDAACLAKSSDLTGSTTVTVNPLPSVTTVGGGFNRNQPVTFSASPNTLSSYVWAGPNGYTGSGASQTISAGTLAAGIYTYTVTFTDANTCQNTANATVVIYDAALYVNSATGSNSNSGTLASPLATIQKAVDVAVTGDVINVAAGTYTENVTVNKAVTLKGANLSTAGCATRTSESTVAGGVGTAFNITASGVTIDGFEITGVTGVASTSATNVAVRNNKMTVAAVGVNAAAIATSTGNTLTVEDNCIALTMQVAGSNATAGIYVSAATGSEPVTLDDNTVTNAFYGYVLYGVNTTPPSVVSDGVITGVMQGVAILNTVSVSSPLLASKVNVSGMNMSGFAGAYPALSAQNFHAGIYTYTAPTTTLAQGITLSVQNCTINGTQTVTQSSAGIYLADFSGGSTAVQTVTVNECNILNNTNRGLDARGRVNATVTNSTFTNNGGAAPGTGGNNGYTMIAQIGATITATNNFITHPATSLSSVTAFLTGNAPTNTIIANNNSVLMNGNTNGKGANNTGGNTLSATCNWWGGIAGTVAPLMTGAVTFEQFLTSGTDNFPATAGFQPAPGTCNGCSSGNSVTNTNTGKTFCSIQGAIDDPTTLAGHVITASAGTYSEQVLVNKGVTIKGIGATKPIINFTGTPALASGKLTLFEIAADNVTIENFEMRVDMTKLTNAVITSGAFGNNLTVKNNAINPIRTGAIGTTYGNRNAIHINYRNFRTSGANQTGIVVENNTVSYNDNGTPADNTDDAGFRSAVATDEAGLTIHQNTFQTVENDIEVRFGGGGNIVATDNILNGAGVRIGEYNAGAGTVTVTGNTFNGAFVNAFSKAALTLFNNYQNKATTVSNNTFSGVNKSISLENYQNVTLSNNTFTPFAGATSYRHIAINTKEFSSSSGSYAPNISATITGNTFNGSGATGGEALFFANQDNDSPVFGTFTVGSSGAENTFNAGIQNFIRFDNSTGTTNPNATATIPWAQNLDAQYNKFNVGSGAKLPETMTFTERTNLENALYHKFDETALGKICLPLPATLSIKSGSLSSICAGQSTILVADIIGATGPFTLVYTDGTTPVTVNSYVSGADISITPSATKTYSIVSVTDAIGCSTTGGTGTPIVTVNLLPTATIGGTTAVCKDATSPNVTFTGAVGTAPYTFTYNINGGTNTTLTTSSGNSVTVAAPTTAAGVFVYNLVSVVDASSTTCSQAQTGSATITVNPLPTATIGGTTAVCKDATSPNVTFTGAGGIAPYTFTYNINGGTNTTLTTSSGNSVTIAAPTTAAGVFVYNLVSVADASSTACSQAQTGSATVTVNPLPIATIGGTTAACKDATSPNVTFTGAVGTAPYTFTYNINGGTNTTVTTSSGNSVTVAAPTTAAGVFVYNLVSVADASSTTCSQAQTGSATITVNPLPTATIGGTTAVCKDATSPNVTFTGAGGTAPYTFTYNINGGTNTTVTTSSGNSVTIAVPTTAAGVFVYNLVSIADASSTACSQAQTGSATVTVNPLPTATIGGTTAVCKDATSPNVTFTGAGGTAPYTFTYNINGGTNTTLTTSSGNSVTVAVPTTTAGVFVYNLVSVVDASSTTCSQAQTGLATVTVNSLPTPVIAGNLTLTCATPTTTLSTTGGGTYAWSNSETGTSITNVGVGSYTVTVTDPNGCVGISPSVTTQYFPVTNTSTSTNYTSIQAAINAASTGNMIEVCSGTYSEQVLVNKGVTIKGVGATKPIINFTGTVTGKPTTFDVSADGVTIENLNFKVDLSKLRSAIIASAAGLDNITVKDNLIEPYGTAVGSYGDRNAVSINYSGPTNYRVATGGVNSITFTGNTVTGSSGSFFRAGIATDEAGGIFTGNTLQTGSNDIVVRFGSNGAISISNNNLNGGGIELAEQNAGAGTLTVSNNTFTAGFNDPTVALLRIKNNSNGKTHIVSSNTFNYNEWALSLENMNNVTLDGNTFLSTSATAHAVVVNTKSLSTNSNAIVQVPLSATIINNNFNGTGTGITFQNHDNDNASYGAFTIGTSGNENKFASTLGSFISFDKQTGSTSGSTFPAYSSIIGTGVSALTTMACWNQNLNAQNNKFDVGAGLQLPSAMNVTQRTALEAALFHKPDASCTGLITYFLPVHNVTQNTYFLTIQPAIAAAVANDVIELSEWTFNEKVTIDKSLTLQGVNTDKSLQVINGTGLGTASGITINNGITGVTIKNLTVQNFTGANGNVNAGIYGIGGNNNLTVDNVALLNNTSASGFYANGPVSNVSITNSMAVNNGGSARGIVIWNGLKSNINISNNMVTNNTCCGIELQDGDASGVTISGNTIDISGGDNAIGLVGLNSTVGANTISNNTITGGGRFGIELKNPNGGTTVSGNNISLTSVNSDVRDRAGISVYRRGVTGSNVNVPTGVTITGNIVSGYVQSSTSTGFGIVVEGTNHSVSGNTVSGCDVGIQQQGGYHPASLPGDGNQNDVADLYFGRGNSPTLCNVTVSGNTYSSNGTDERIVIGGGTGTIVTTTVATVDDPTDQVVCNNGATATVTFSGNNLPGVVYKWTNSAASIGLLASGISATIPTFTATNSTNAPVIATITVTPSVNGCDGTPQTFTITVNPTPTVDDPTDQTVCNGVSTSAITFTGSATGTTYTWTNDNTSIGLAASGTGTIAAFAGANTTNAPVVATIVVTPHANGCDGSTQTFTITVNPTPTVDDPTDQIVCNGANTSAVTFESAFDVAGTTYTWTNNTTSIGLAASGTGTIAAFAGANTTNVPVVATIVVTPHANGCDGPTQTFTITVNPTPMVDDPTDQIVCNGANTSAIAFTGNVTGTSYTWTNSTTSIGLAASGTGTIAAFAGANTTNAPVVATIVVTPHANGCDGPTQTFTITVNPTPTVDDPTDQTVCNGVNTSAVTFASAFDVTGTTYTWTNNTTSIGLAASGTGTIAAFAGANTTNAPVVATIVVTPHANGCDGPTQTFTITVNPTPTVDDPTDQTVCNGANTSAIAFTGNVTGTTYTWTNDNTSIGLAASGTGTIAAFAGANTTNAPVVATIVVTPHANGCDGPTQTFTITVNPTPMVDDPTDQIVCNGANTSAIAFIGNVTGTTYTWTNSTTSIGLAASGTGTIAAFAGANTTNAPVVATIVVTPHANGCDGPTQTFTITVNPTPTVDNPTDQTVCNGANTSAIAFTGNVTGTTYTWTNNTTSIGLAGSGTGTIAAFAGANTTNAPVVATIVVTPHANGCDGPTQTFTITVNPTPTVDDPTDQIVCNGANTSAIAFTGNVTGTTYTWTNNTTSIGLAASGTGTIAAFVGANTTNAPVVATIVVTPHANGCDGPTQTFTITVNPTPTVDDPTDQTVCNGANTSAITFTGSVTGTTYTWTNDNTSIGLVATGTGNIAAFAASNATFVQVVTAHITVTPSVNGCDGTPQTFTITVNPTPTMAATSNITACNGETVSETTLFVTPTGFTVDISGGSTVGLADATGATSIPSFTALNTGTAPVTVTVALTPKANNCTGTAVTYTITVDPTPVVVAPNNVSACVGSTVSSTTLSGTPTGVKFDISGGSTVGLADATGLTSIPSFTAVNTGTTPLTATVTITPKANGCTGTPVTYSITVNPLPVVESIEGPGYVYYTSTIKLTNATLGGAWSSSSTIAGITNDGTEGTGIQHSFAIVEGFGQDQGTATISYKITDVNGCVNTSTKEIKVNPGLLDIGIFTGTAGKLVVKVKPIADIIAADYTGGVFTVKTSTGVSSLIAPSLLNSTYKYGLYESATNVSGSNYYTFQVTTDPAVSVTWNAGQWYEIATLEYNGCAGQGTFELVTNDSWTNGNSVGRNYYQELFSTAAQGVIEAANASVTTQLDVLPPVLTEAADQDVNLGANCSVTIPDVRGSATDHGCTGTIITQSPAIGAIVSSSHNATITVTITATDAAGLTDVDVVVLTAKDVTAPVLTEAADQDVNLDANCSVTIPDVRGTATDNGCLGTVITQSPAIGDVVLSSHNSTITVTVTATDGANLTDVKTVVLTAKDVTAPVLTAGANQNVNLGADCKIIVPSVIGTATDNCTIVSIVQSPVAGTLVSASHNGTVDVTVTATDGANLTDVKTVVLTAKDITAPVLTAGANQNVNLGADCKIIVPSVIGTATDNCTIVSIVQSPVAGTLVSASHNGIVDVTVTATDGANLTDVKTVVLTAKDVTAPVLTAGLDQDVNLGTDCKITVPSVIGTATDNCTVVSLVQSPVAGTLVSAVHNGKVNVTVTATDGANLTDVKTVVLTAKDMTAPTITAPIGITTSVNATSCSAVIATLGVPTTADNCTVVSKTWSATGTTPTSGDATTSVTFPLGQTTVTWTVTDGAGLTATTSQLVTVTTSLEAMAITLGSPAICTGDVTTLSFTIAGGNTSLPYSIVYSINGVNQPAVSSATLPLSISPTTTGTVATTYTYALVSVTDGFGCVINPSGLSTTLTVNPLPTLSITQPIPVCVGLNLNNVIKGENISGGTFSYHATLADAQANTSPLSGTAVTNAGTSIYVRYTLPTGCYVTGLITVTTGACVEIEARIALQGPYDVANSIMKDNLRAAGLIPLSDPYSTTDYNTAFAHVNGDGVKTVAQSVLNVTGTNAIVDWVFVELRDKVTKAVVATRSGLLQRDGDIVDVNGTGSLRFLANFDQYYLAVRHRNHLGVMTAAPVTYSASITPTPIDFTLPTTAVYTNPALASSSVSNYAPRKVLYPGKLGLWAGNANISAVGLNNISYNGEANDRASILSKVGSSTPLNIVAGYLKEDLNMNGNVSYNGTGNDRAIILGNLGSSTPNNIILQHFQ